MTNAQTYSAQGQESLDRMEAEYTSQASAQLARMDAARGHTVRGMTDASLNRLTTVYSRQLEDIQSGQRRGTKAQQRLLKAKLHDIEVEQEIRDALAYSWLAAENGTHSYTDFMRRGGLKAVADAGATPPSYKLAELLDWERYKLGTLHALVWGPDDRR